jgi:hypothetical protein
MEQKPIKDLFLGEMSIEQLANELEKNGYDGLVGPIIESCRCGCSACRCGCSTKDFMPCGETSEECIPAYRYELKNNNYWMDLKKGMSQEEVEKITAEYGW